MAIHLIHVSDIHFGSGESHGRINPDTGLNTRLEDFVLALKKVVDYAISQNIDVFLFSGDAYKNASPEPIYQKLFARELKRLSEAGIKTILVVGNHDQILRSTQSHAMSVFQSLEVANVLTVDKPTFELIETKNGPFQLIGLPHITRNNLMAMDKYSGFSSSQIDDVLVHHVHDMLRDYYDELDPLIPCVVTAHMSLDRALAGIEQELLVGYTLTFPSDIFIDSRVDYVAMGHIHKHQVIRDKNPTIVYAGSLERVDFGEEREDKGFIHVILERNKTDFSFKTIDPRPFVTVDVDVTKSVEPTEDIVKCVNRDALQGCVLRVRYKVLQDQMLDVDESQIYRAARDCMSVRVQPEIVNEHMRGRLPELTETSVASPLRALETYLDEVAPDRKDKLIERARDVMTQLNAELHNEDG
ncbi:exonuclease SbcCD subunit D [Candidatus Obscuribacterales bacterium]|nr:exonuclease SbcCD subunit D [Candidatus Obscuribacterales bacterium]